MKKKSNKGKESRTELSRRDFIKTTATAGTAAVAGISALKVVESGSVAASTRPLPELPSTEPARAPEAPAVVEQFAEDPALAVGQEFAVRASFPIGNPGALPHARQDHEQVFPKVNRQAVLFALGDTLIPSAPGDPGYRDLEWYGITEEVSRRLAELPDSDLDLFNRSSAAEHGKPFADLPEAKRAEHINMILKAGAIKDEAEQKRLKDIYSHARELIFTVYYQNFPEDHWPRDGNRVPLLRPGDQHQITNPNTSAVVTGWDIAGYAGPLTWEEEERRRNYFKKIMWEE
jgi:hypothetical protein